MTGNRHFAKENERRQRAALKEVRAQRLAERPRSGLPMSVRIPQLLLASLNVREHHFVEAARVRRERGAVRLVLGSRNPPTLPCVVTMVRQYPGTYDDDNATGACKHVRDEIADWLGLPNDADPRVSWRVEQERVPRNRAGVLIRFEQRRAF